MSIRTVYSTNDAMSKIKPSEPNAYGCGIALGVHDAYGTYGLHTFNLRGEMFALLDREELALLHAAIGAELKRTEQ